MTSNSLLARRLRPPFPSRSFIAYLVRPAHGAFGQGACYLLPTTTTPLTQLSGNEAQRIAGRNADHVAAGKASGAKRKANAMSEEEGKRRKAAHIVSTAVHDT